MTILTDTQDIQSFKIVPRYYPETVTLKVTDDLTQTSVEYPYTASYNYSSLVVSQSFELIEGHFYILEVFDDTSNVFRGRIFCTNQEDYDRYDITSGSFTSTDGVDNIILI